MRGKVIDSNFNMVALRITPAYAGKSTNAVTASGNLKDHPRLCGEKFYNGNKFLFEKGSPPPMRGKGCKF